MLISKTLDYNNVVKPNPSALATYSYRFEEANEWQKLNCEVNYKLIGRRETFGVEAGRIAYAQNALMLCTDKSKQTKRDLFFLYSLP